LAVSAWLLTLGLGSWLLASCQFSVPSISVGEGFFDSGAKGFVWQDSRVVKGDATGAVEQDESWRGAAAIVIEICRADGDGNAPKPRVEVLPDAIDPGKLSLRIGWLALSGVAVKLGRCDDGQAFGPELCAEPGDDWAFGFTVGAPVSPEKEQHG